MLNEKYPGGVEAQKELLEEEGYKIIRKGRKYVVDDYKKSIVSIARLKD